MTLLTDSLLVLVAHQSLPGGTDGFSSCQQSTGPKIDIKRKKNGKIERKLEIKRNENQAGGLRFEFLLRFEYFS